MSVADPIRVVRVLAPPLRSQTIYHAVGYQLGPTDPDTILVITPRAPYVSVGFHQDVEREVDVAACQARGLPIVRREPGGGAVYLDDGQVFVNWVFHAGRLPAALDRRFAAYAAPLVETYRRFGVEAEYRPINDIHVHGRKIGGTGAVRLGAAELLVGSLMFDFDHDAMARVLRVSSEKMRDKVHRALRDYVTSLTRELGAAPDRDTVVEHYLAECGRVLGRRVETGPLRGVELARAAELDTVMSEPAWTFRKTGRRMAGVRIHEDVSVHEATRKSAAGLIRITLTRAAGSLVDVTISGDVTVLPHAALDGLESRLRGAPADLAVLAALVRDWFETAVVDAPGLGVDDIVAVLGDALTRTSPPG